MPLSAAQSDLRALLAWDPDQNFHARAYPSHHRNWMGGEFNEATKRDAMGACPFFGGARILANRMGPGPNGPTLLVAGCRKAPVGDIE